MFAVIKIGGQQHRVSENSVITVNRLEGEAGASIQLGEVLMLGGEAGITLGAPLVAGAAVTGEILEHSRDDKVIAFKKRRRQNSKRRRGHRQHQTTVRVTAISA